MYNPDDSGYTTNSSAQLPMQNVSYEIEVTSSLSDDLLKNKEWVALEEQDNCNRQEQAKKNDKLRHKISNCWLRKRTNFQSYHKGHS